ncbi:hypothetical protein WJX72_008352 [[Myrmecia] bisecta]|uniref:Uncharacterized protein n=1 Tax=[Myrmecia] bisecta TaxID=41462 RepID=A0AAW1Q0L8_9CHLO
MAPEPPPPAASDWRIIFSPLMSRTAKSRQRSESDALESSQPLQELRPQQANLLVEASMTTPGLSHQLQRSSIAGTSSLSLNRASTSSSDSFGSSQSPYAVGRMPTRVAKAHQAARRRGAVSAVPAQAAPRSLSSTAQQAKEMAALHAEARLREKLLRSQEAKPHLRYSLQVDACSQALQEVFPEVQPYQNLLKLIKDSYDGAWQAQATPKQPEPRTSITGDHIQQDYIASLQQDKIQLSHKVSQLQQQVQEQEDLIDNLKRERKLERSDAAEQASVLAASNASVKQLTSLLSAVSMGEMTASMLQELGLPGPPPAPADHAAAYHPGQPKAVLSSGADVSKGGMESEAEFQESLKQQSMFRGVDPLEISWGTPLSARQPAPRPAEVPQLRLKRVAA